MKKFQAAAIVLSIWAGLNAMAAVVSTYLTIAHQTPPALRMALADKPTTTIEPGLLDAICALAALANPIIVAFCLLIMVIVWRWGRQGDRVVFLACSGALVPLQGFAFISDGYLGHHNLAANLVSVVLLTTALSLWALALRDTNFAKSIIRGT